MALSPEYRCIQQGRECTPCPHSVGQQRTVDPTRSAFVVLKMGYDVHGNFYRIVYFARNAHINGQVFSKKLQQFSNVEIDINNQKWASIPLDSLRAVFHKSQWVVSSDCLIQTVAIKGGGNTSSSLEVVKEERGTNSSSSSYDIGNSFQAIKSTVLMDREFKIVMPRTRHQSQTSIYGFQLKSVNRTYDGLDNVTLQRTLTPEELTRHTSKFPTDYEENMISEVDSLEDMSSIYLESEIEFDINGNCSFHSDKGGFVTGDDATFQHRLQIVRDKVSVYAKEINRMNAPRTRSNSRESILNAPIKSKSLARKNAIELNETFQHIITTFEENVWNDGVCQELLRISRLPDRRALFSLLNKKLRLLIPQQAGTLNFVDGFYEGEWKRGYFTGYIIGRGVMRYHNGDHYRGQWKMELDLTRWHEDFSFGMRHGEGTLTYSATGQGKKRRTKDPDTYVPVMYKGSWRDNKEHGEGKELYSNDQQYQGSWKLGKRDGFGVLFYPNGKKKTKGWWKAGKKHGPGSLYYPDGLPKFDGHYKNDREHGHCTQYWLNGTVYDGTWVDGKETGNGSYYNKKSRFGALDTTGEQSIIPLLLEEEYLVKTDFDIYF